jgi:hypothetical protein
VLAKVTFVMSKMDPALCVMAVVADYYSLHRNLRLDFINGRSATLKTLIESKLEMYKSDLKKDFHGFVANLEKMAFIHDEHCRVVQHTKTDSSGMKNTGGFQTLYSVVGGN